MSEEIVNRFEGYFQVGTLSVVGVQHHDWKQRMHQFVPGLKTRLRAEPSNPHDQWAVRVEAKVEGEVGTMVGYLAKGQKMLSLMLRNGHDIRIEPREDPTGIQPQVDVWLRKGPLTA